MIEIFCRVRHSNLEFDFGDEAGLDSSFDLHQPDRQALIRLRLKDTEAERGMTQDTQPVCSPAIATTKVFSEN